ncbi:hypothetical protein CsSME_00036163 [Camellia sinensis var. sinensis]
MAGRLLLSLPLCIKRGHLPCVVVVSLPKLTKCASTLVGSKPSYPGRQMPTYHQHPR